MDEDLERIRAQAGFLARCAQELLDLQRILQDKGSKDPSSSELRLAQQRLSGAFMAVVRVTSAYL